MACIEFQFEEFFESFRGKGKGRALWKMVHKSTNSGEIYGASKKFHAIVSK